MIYDLNYTDNNEVFASINEAFNFDDETPSVVNQTACDIIEYDCIRLIQKSNMKIPLNMLIPAVYKFRCPRGINQAGELPDGTPCWHKKTYIPKDLESEILLWSDLSSAEENNMENAGWKKLFNHSHGEDFSKDEIYSFDIPKSEQARNMLFHLFDTIGVPANEYNTGKINCVDYYDRDKRVAYRSKFAGFISPDESMIYVQAMIYNEPQNGSYYSRDKIFANCIATALFFTGTIHYTLNKSAMAKTKKEVLDTERIKGLTKRTCNDIFNYNERNVYTGNEKGELPVDESGHRCIILGYTDTIDKIEYCGYEKSLYDKATAAGTTYIKQDYETTGLTLGLWKNEKSRNNAIKHVFGNSIMYTKNWSLVGAAKHLVCLKHRSKMGYLYVSSNLNAIRNLFGDDIANECAKRPIIEQYYKKTDPTTQYFGVIYAFIWMNKKFNYIYEAVAKRKLGLTNVYKSKTWEFEADCAKEMLESDNK